MLLAIDIGNTNIVFGAYQQDRLVGTWRAATAPERMPDEYAMLVHQVLAYHGLGLPAVRAVVIGSVVPPLTATFTDLCRTYLRLEPLVVGPGIRTGIRILYENPKEVGADRIANALAAYHRYGGPAIIIDLGTATTLDAINRDGDYLGGAIAPGLLIAAQALFERAARLYRVELAKPRTAVGRNTVQALQSGILYGYAGLVEGLVRRFQQEMGPARVIATGGLAEIIADEVPAIEVVDPHLTLEGLRLIYELNREESR
jgi:type III pantothenate kinase